MKAIAACDEPRINSTFLAILLVRHIRTVGFDCVECNCVCFIYNGYAPLRCCIHQVFSYFSLSVDHNMLSCETFHRDMNQTFSVSQRDAVMRQALSLQAFVQSELRHDVNCTALQHACPDTGKDMRSRFAFQNDGVHASLGQQMTEHQP